ncbi:type II toxin-antitoxin system YafQ family toxin [Bifidobacterium sp. ESL0763]|uniref:type II toxin-antitoxin system YafQ family toxin n=1 Tax=Bifidobacterium sp. ESL0763 TaxID=2983227 RepID=UPI0023F9EE83|nr:type II toxin-antitoxin system YafQ family toxin [Bifidobacterium sp. ESL0763]MDF7664143.1 type II toxin-antitoxin system YafQ family toxin [Bifidobacterium sp. ESL0763]
MLEVYYSAAFLADLRRLKRYDRACVEELRDLMVDELQVEGRVPDGYRPHILDNPGGLYNGCVEFHLRDDVLVLYTPAKPKASVTMRRICTHAELTTGRFGREWPKGDAR